MTTPNWFKQAVSDLDEDYRDGLLTDEQFDREMEALEQELWEEQGDTYENV